MNVNEHGKNNVFFPCLLQFKKSNYIWDESVDSLSDLVFHSLLVDLVFDFSLVVSSFQQDVTGCWLIDVMFEPAYVFTDPTGGPNPVVGEVLGSIGYTSFVILNV